MPHGRPVPRRRRERAFHSAVTAGSPSNLASHERISRSRWASGMPRPGGAPEGSICCKEATNDARSRAAWIESISSTGTDRPSTQVKTSQNQVASVGRPCATGTGISSEQRREPRKPVEFLGARPRRAVPAREPNRPVVTEAKDRVVGPRGLDPTERQVSPLPELLAHQPAHERLVDIELVCVHRGHARTCQPGFTRRRSVNAPTAKRVPESPALVAEPTDA